MGLDRFKEGRYVWVPYDPINDTPSHFAKIVKVDDKIQEGDNKMFKWYWVFITVEGPFGKDTYPSHFLGATCDISDEEYAEYLKYCKPYRV